MTQADDRRPREQLDRCLLEMDRPRQDGQDDKGRRGPWQEHACIFDASSDGKCDVGVVVRVDRVLDGAYAHPSRYILGEKEDTLGKVEVSNDELRTVRDAMRELNRMVDLLDSGESEKFVLTKHGQMRAVVLSVDCFASLRSTTNPPSLTSAA